MKRRWEPGTRTVLGGVTYRVVAGRKTSRVTGAEDLKLEAWTPRGWQAVPMSVGAMMADFFHENEEVLYPRSMGYQGGSYYVSYLHQAIAEGWEPADARLRGEKQARAAKAAQTSTVGPAPETAPETAEEAELDRLFEVAWAKAHRKDAA